MDDARDLDLEHQRRLRAERVLAMLGELWGDGLPPGPNAELAVLIDTIALDDDHGAGEQLITQRDGLTYAMVAELITHHRPDTATLSDLTQVIDSNPAPDPAPDTAPDTAALSDVASPPASSSPSSFRLPPQLEAVLTDLHLLEKAPSTPATPAASAPEQPAPTVATASTERTQTPNIVKPAQVGMWEIDPRSGDVAYDGVSAQLLGLGSEAGHSTVAQHLNELIHPADRDRVAEAITYALSTETTYRVRFRVITALGIPTWLISQGRVLNKPSDPSARLTGYLTLAAQPQQRNRELTDLG